MLTNARTATTLPVENLERAKAFYTDKLGLKTSTDVPGGAMLEAGEGQRIMLYQRERTKADHTVIGFEVENVEMEVKELRGRGIVFEEYDRPDLKTVDSIATLGTWKAAWFKDTEGNILSINEMK
jgi:catechol 2,3-dioxygenase-like lactoylglutathione lyase family enzyme